MRHCTSGHATHDNPQHLLIKPTALGNSLSALAVVTATTSSTDMPLRRAISRAARCRFAGTLTAPRSGASAGASVSSTRLSRGNPATSCCMCDDRTTLGGTLKKKPADAPRSACFSLPSNACNSARRAPPAIRQSICVLFCLLANQGCACMCQRQARQHTAGGSSLTRASRHGLLQCRGKTMPPQPPTPTHRMVACRARVHVQRQVKLVGQGNLLSEHLTLHLPQLFRGADRWAAGSALLLRRLQDVWAEVQANLTDCNLFGWPVVSAWAHTRAQRATMRVEAGARAVCGCFWNSCFPLTP